MTPPKEKYTNIVPSICLIDALGYTDQSHLINDFKNMLGVTPKQYTQLKKD
ncbi:AraC family transcriptional regulator [Pseudoalteromonas sp. SCSIO 43088]|uniref:AraC family transcriptional regulator n=1 Tax=Pseudoalteromonas sp. SCSIO 43088 TaxID=2822846 RepID=UPI0021882893|nr:AraC family transcriptional regulator [Pseudoalteromonas sp. SCSIO 43088]